mgnify:CR=1 FL=1
MKIEQRLISELIPYANNARTHNAEQITQIASSIKEFGFNNPILIDKDNGIIAGHGRLEAAKKLNLTEAPTIRLDHLTNAQRKAFMLADNRIAVNSDWDTELLSLELKDLDADFDLTMLGFDEKELASLLNPEQVEGLTDEDAVPDVPDEPTTKLGDIWVLGDHRIMCGDATNGNDIDKLMNGKKADISFTSPPYNMGKNATLHGNTNLEDNKYQTYNDDNPEYLSLLINFTELQKEYSKYVFVNLQHLAGNKIDLIDYQYSNKKDYVDTIIWDKGHTAPAMAENVLNSRFEYIFIYSKYNNSRSINTGKFRGTIDNVYTESGQKNNEFSKVHSATFPVHLPLFIIEAFTQKNNIVNDMFLGSGTTLIAAEKTNRKCYGMELDPRYVDVSVNRWEDFTGKKADILQSPSEL